jgi:hypothetical protein
MQDQSFLFYDMMWYPVPAQASVFCYQELSRSSAEQDKELSFPDYPLNTQIQELCKIFGILCKNTIFLEAVYIHGDYSFKAWATEQPVITMLAICSQKRVYSAYYAYKILDSILRCLCRWKKIPYRITLNVWLDEEHCNLVDQMSSSQDVGTLYWIAHMSELYQSYPQKHDIFGANNRISSYLPNRTPTQHIHLDIHPTLWFSPFKRFLESFLSGMLWNILEHLLKHTTRYLSFIAKKLRILSKNKKFLHHSIWLNEDKRHSITILWKMFRKEMML